MTEEISRTETQPTITTIQAYALNVQKTEKTDMQGNVTPTIAISLYLKKGYKNAQGEFVSVGEPIMVTWDKSELPGAIVTVLNNLRASLLQLATAQLGGTFIP